LSSDADTSVHKVLIKNDAMQQVMRLAPAQSAHRSTPTYCCRCFHLTAGAATSVGDDHEFPYSLPPPAHAPTARIRCQGSIHAGTEYAVEQRRGV
jgi:hypothetical protein